MHDIVGVSITVAAIVASTVFNNRSVNALRTELCGEFGSIQSGVHSFRSEVMGKLDSIQKDLRDLYAMQARHNFRISNLEQRHKN